VFPRAFKALFKASGRGTSELMILVKNVEKKKENPEAVFVAGLVPKSRIF